MAGATTIHSRVAAHLIQTDNVVLTHIIFNLVYLVWNRQNIVNNSTV